MRYALQHNKNHINTQHDTSEKKTMYSYTSNRNLEKMTENCITYTLKLDTNTDEIDKLKKKISRNYKRSCKQTPIIHEDTRFSAYSSLHKSELYIFNKLKPM